MTTEARIAALLAAGMSVHIDTAAASVHDTRARKLVAFEYGGTVESQIDRALDAADAYVRDEQTEDRALAAICEESAT